MNLLNNVKIINVYGSTAAGVGTTGDAGGTTAGSTTNVGQSSGGGLPSATTGVDTQGFGGVVFVASVSNSTNAVLKAAYSASSTTAITGWTDLPGNYAGLASTAPSTASALLTLDVIKPTKRYVNAIVQVPSSSAVVESVIAILYQPDKAPITQITSVSNQSAIGSTAQAS